MLFAYEYYVLLIGIIITRAWAAYSEQAHIANAAISPFKTHIDK